MHILYMVALGAEAILGILLTVLVLLHSAKGEGMGGIGGQAVMFGGQRGAEAGLDRVTYIVAIAFVIICTLLGFGIIRP
jgi:preprotein translocase subunit SecG